MHRKKIAVIGSGISGLGCAWLLNKAHDVTLFEKDDRLGGHSNTVSFDLDGQNIDVDTGFIVYNPVNYPNLVKLFDCLAVESCETDMSFAASVRDGAMEYAGTNLTGLFAQKTNLVNPAFWRMLADLLRFYRQADQMLKDNHLPEMSLRQLLEQGNYSRSFIENHLLPMSAAIWSTPAEQMLDYPAISFLRFSKNHGLLQFANRPQWRTVVGGSKQYVAKIAAELGSRTKLNSRIHRVKRTPDKVIIEDLHGRQQEFDEVVLACHSDQALAMLDCPTDQERELLQRFPYQRNKAYLHLDQGLMPRRKAVWASWNYLSSEEDDHSQQVSVSYWMNRLQPLATDKPIMVSLNPIREPGEGSIIRSFFYDHPLFTQQSLVAQQSLWQLQGQQRTWFCGAYFGYGFHEDGLQAGLAVAEQLGGIPRPWRLSDPSNRIVVNDKPIRWSLPDSKERVHA